MKTKNLKLIKLTTIVFMVMLSIEKTQAIIDSEEVSFGSNRSLLHPLFIDIVDLIVILSPLIATCLFVFGICRLYAKLKKEKKKFQFLQFISSIILAIIFSVVGFTIFFIIIISFLNSKSLFNELLFWPLYFLVIYLSSKAISKNQHLNFLIALSITIFVFSLITGLLFNMPIIL